MNPYRLYRRLERRYDGEIPDHLRRVALAGSSAALSQALAQANSHCCDRLALSAVRLAAARRIAVGELDLWRREGLVWHGNDASSR